SVGAVGSAPLSYQWYFKNAPLAGAMDRTLSVDTTFDDVAGEYFVVVANSSGSVTSRVARLIFQVLVPGVFNTGVDDSGNALPDGSTDTHYKLVVNPDGTGDMPLVENSGVFPIVNGPWVANNAGSKWIGPRFETSASAGGAGADGNYTYRLTI